MISIERLFTVMPNEVDEQGYLTAESFQRYFQIASDRHSDLLGCGWNEMRSASAYWVISRFRMEILRRPAVGEIIHLTTWPNPASPSGVIRNYLVDNSNHEIIAKGMALWSVVSMMTDKAISATDFPLLDQSVPFSSEKVFADGFERMNIVFDLQDPIFPKKIAYRYIDKNGHVNNAFYITGTEKAIRQFYLPNFHASSYQIHYLAPVFAEEMVRLHIKCDGTFYFGEAFTLREGNWLKAFQIKLS